MARVLAVRSKAFCPPWAEILLVHCVIEGGPSFSFVFSQVVSESEEVFGPSASLTGPLPAVAELRGLQFTEACLREALRKYR